MPIKIKAFYDNHQRIIRFLLYLLIVPFLLVLINYLTNTLFNLGIGTGTFLRALYELVVY